MKIPRTTLVRVVTVAMVTAFPMTWLAAAEPGSEVKAAPLIETATPPGRCEDPVAAVATVSPELNCRFFKKTKTSYHWGIVEHDDGSIENTFGDKITSDDLVRVEHTADCTSSHQGNHMMEFCDAVTTKDGVKLCISGGMPAYASELNVTINNKLEYKCSFSAVYPGPTGTLRWNITGKSLKLKAAKLESGQRLRGWISVEFEEKSDNSAESRSYKIEGYFKPVIQTLQEKDQSKEGNK